MAYSQITEIIMLWKTIGDQYSIYCTDPHVKQNFSHLNFSEYLLLSMRTHDTFCTFYGMLCYSH